MTKKEKDMMLPPKKRAVSYEDSPNGLDLTTDASRQSSAATSPPEAARSPQEAARSPPVTARSPPANARSPAAPATRSPGPMDLKIKDDRHSNLSPQGRFYLESRMTASRKSPEPPTLNFTIKEDKDDVPIQRTLDSGLIKVKDEPLSEEPLQSSTPPTADTYRELQHFIARRGNFPAFTPQSHMNFIYNALPYVLNVPMNEPRRQASPPLQHIPRQTAQLDIGQIRYPISHPADLSHHRLLAASTLHPQAAAAVVMPPGRLIPDGSGRLLTSDVSLSRLAKPEPVKNSAGQIFFNSIHNRLDMSEEKRPRARSPQSIRNNFNSFEVNRSRDSFSMENGRDSFTRENGRDSFSRENGRDSFTRENGRESYSREYDDDSFNSEDDVDVGGTPEPPIRPSGFSKQSKFMDEKNIHNYPRGERSNSFEGGRKNSKDLKRARDNGMDHLFQDLISLPHEEFTEMCEKNQLNKQQIDLAREFRRRGKNKVAAQNCRKRKMNQVTELTGKVEDAKRKAAELDRMDEESAKILDEEKAKMVLVIDNNLKQGYKMYCIQCETSVMVEDDKVLDCWYLHPWKLLE